MVTTTTVSQNTEGLVFNLDSVTFLSKSNRYTPQFFYNFDRLCQKHLWMLQQLEKSERALNGIPVELVANSDGSRVGEDIRGTIIRVSYASTGGEIDPRTLIFRVLGRQDDIWEVQLFQLEPIGRATPQKDKRTEEQKAEAKRQRTLTSIAKQIEGMKNYSFRNAESKKLDFSRRVESTKSLLVAQQKELKDAEELLKKGKPESFTVQMFLKEIELVKRHKKVEAVWLTNQGRLNILTKTLFRTNYETDTEDRSTPLGRLLLQIVYVPGGAPHMRGMNVDFWATGSGEYHPHISSGGTVCWGDNQNEIINTLKAGSLYAAVDFSITFMSLFPHPGGNPYLDYGVWLARKVVIPGGSGKPAVVRAFLDENALFAEDQKYIEKLRQEFDVRHTYPLQEPVDSSLNVPHIYIDMAQGATEPYNPRFAEDEEDDD